jgi:hypothetical protein
MQRKGLMHPASERGNDCLTTFLAGAIGLIVFGALIILLLAAIFE